MRLPIYLDYMATTPVDPRVVECMSAYLTADGVFGNPASRSHIYGWEAEKAVELARAQVAALIHAQPEEIIWVSGATEANNLAILGAARFYQRQGKHIITCKTAHKAVLDPCAQLQREGYEVTYLTPQSNGVLDLEQLATALRRDTVLVTILHANNETGVVQDIAAIGALTRQHGVILHVDAAQSFGKIPIDVQHMAVDLLSISGHKIYAPKGIGALYIRRRPRLRLQPLLYGGGQEYGLRPGTLPTHQIVALGEAAQIAQQVMVEEAKRTMQLRQSLLTALAGLASEVNGDPVQRLPGAVNISFTGVDAATLIPSLTDVAVATGSACLSGSAEPSHVLRAMGLSETRARAALRFSIGRFTTAAEIDHAAAAVLRCVLATR